MFFKHNHTKDIELDLKKVALLNNCYTMDLFCNSDLIENITKSGRNTTVKGNDGTL